MFCMEVLLLILPFALLISIAFIASFIYAVRSGQYDDLETPAYRALLDDEDIENELTQNGEV